MRRWGLLLTWTLAMLVIGLVPLAIGWGNVPDPVASHWGVSGAPDGSLPLVVVPLVIVGLIGIGLLSTSLFRVEGEPTAEAFAMVGLVGGLGAALTSLLVYLNWGAVTWEEAGAFDVWHIVVVLVGVLGGGLAGFIVGHKWYPERHAPKADGPVIDVAPGERVSWVGRTSVRWPLFLLGGAVLMLVVLPDWGTGWRGSLCSSPLHSCRWRPMSTTTG